MFRNLKAAIVTAGFDSITAFSSGIQQALSGKRDFTASDILKLRMDRCKLRFYFFCLTVQKTGQKKEHSNKNFAH